MKRNIYFFILLMLLLLLSACGTKEKVSGESTNKAADSEWKQGDKAAVLGNTCLIYKKKNLDIYMKALVEQNMETLMNMDMETHEISCGISDTQLVTILEIDGKKVKVKTDIMGEPKTGWLGLTPSYLARTFDGKILSVKDNQIEVESTDKANKGKVYTVQLEEEDTMISNLNFDLKVVADLEKDDEVRVILFKSEESDDMVARNVILLSKM